MTNHARNGAARERRVIHWMKDRGWLLIMRSAASKGVADFCALHPFYGLAFVQVGTAKSKRLSPLDRDRLVAVAEMTHALPLIATSGPGVPTRLHVVTRETASKWKEFVT